MADFDNLLENIDETQPRVSQSSVERTSSSHEEPGDGDGDIDAYHQTTQYIHSLDDNDDTNEEANVVPPVLEQALLQQSNESSNFLQNKSLEEPFGELEKQEAQEKAEYAALKRLWVQELNSSELCYYDEDLIEHAINLLNECEEIPDKLQEQGRSDADHTLASVAASICKMDMERLRFVLVDLFRIRLEKIEKYALHNRECLDRMSVNEVEYLKSYGELIQKHLGRTVTDHIPKALWKRLDEPDMIPHPDLDTFVFCKVVEEEGIIIHDFKDMELSQQEEDGVHFQIGEILFVRYRTIRDYVQEGKVELIM